MEYPDGYVINTCPRGRSARAGTGFRKKNRSSTMNTKLSLNQTLAGFLMYPLILWTCFQPYRAQAQDQQTKHAEATVVENSPQPDLEEIKSRILAATVTIESTDSPLGGSGATGFLVEYEGRKHVVTNIHVLMGAGISEADSTWSSGPRNPKSMTNRISAKARNNISYEEYLKFLRTAPMPVIKNIDGAIVNPDTNSPMLLSSNADIAMIPVSTESKCLEISNNKIKNSSDIMVAGNPGAEHVINVYLGTLKASGPDRLEFETKSEMLEGMSGGPVVDVATGQVIGIVTYKIEEAKPSKAENQAHWIYGEVGDSIVNVAYGTLNWVVRNFAFKLNDSIKLEEKTSWSGFMLDCGHIVSRLHKYKNGITASQILFDDEPQDINPDFDHAISMSVSRHKDALMRLYADMDEEERTLRVKMRRNTSQGGISRSYVRTVGNKNKPAMNYENAYKKYSSDVLREITKFEPKYNIKSKWLQQRFSGDFRSLENLVVKELSK